MFGVQRKISLFFFLKWLWLLSGEWKQECKEEEEEEIVVDNSAKYSIDNKIACVTYGEENTPYKTFILNFNDYAVQTTYNGVTYTIEAYGYVVIQH